MRKVPPERALLRADATGIIALSAAVDAEIEAVLGRAKFASVLAAERRAQFVASLRDAAVWFDPTIPVNDCRDAKDNKHLELALAAGADIIVSSDDDRLVLSPWRGVRIMREAECVAIRGPC